MWSQCWSAFSTLAGLSIRYSSLQVRSSIRSSTATSWGSLRRTRGRSGQTNGEQTECSIMTMHLHRPLWLCSSFRPPKTWRCLSPPLIRLI
jgi:hypothetical protein